MRHVARNLVAVLLLLGSISPAVAETPRLQVLLDSLQAGYARAREARKNGDLPGYLDQLEQVVRVAPNIPRLTYRLAGAHALLGHRDEAVRRLERVMRLGAGLDALEDPDFASLRGDAAFESLAIRIRAALAPAGSSEVAIRLSERDLFPEGIAYDPASRTFFLSSLNKRKIVAIDSTGSSRDFTREGRDSLWCGLGMKVDALRRRLWVATSVEEFMGGFRREDLYKAALLCYDLDSERLRTRSVLGNQPSPHLLNDLAVARDGTVYVTDTVEGTVYRADGETGRLERLLEPGTLPNANGIALSGDEARLYVAHAFGIASVGLPDLRVADVACPDSLTAASIDGLYCVGERLIAFQTSLERVARFDLDPAGVRIAGSAVIEGHNPHFRQITTGVVVGDTLYYIATCQYESFGPGGSVPSLEELSDILVLKTGIRP